MDISATCFLPVPSGESSSLYRRKTNAPFLIFSPADADRLGNAFQVCVLSEEAVSCLANCTVSS